MAHSADLRTLVLQFIEKEAVKRKPQNVSTLLALRFTKGSTHRTPSLAEHPGPDTPRWLDPTAIAEHVKAYPDLTLDERARHFGVSKSCIAYRLTRLGYTRKKTVGYKEHCPTKTISLSAVAHSGESLCQNPRLH